MASWWADKVRQFGAHLRARVGETERSSLSGWLTAPELALFDTMHVADRRHGLDVVAHLRTDGVAARDVLVAGLLHDAGKRQVGVGPRVAWSLGERYGGWIWRWAGLMPGWRGDLSRLRDHAQTSAGLAAAAGCTERTVGLIRHQEAPLDPDAGERLRLADEAS
jgi:hypothetical protein